MSDLRASQPPAPSAILEGLLLELFEWDELIVWIAQFPWSSEVRREIPIGATTSASVHHLVMALLHRRLIDQAFFSAMRHARPRRNVEIESFERTWEREGPKLRGTESSHPKEARKGTRPIEVFICYSRKDGPLVDMVVGLLRAAGNSVFRDTDSIPVGEEWRPYLAEALEDARIVFVFWCDHSRSSPEVHEEVRLAQRLGKRIVPVWLDGDRSAPLCNYQGIESTALVELHSRLQKVPDDKDGKNLFRMEMVTGPRNETLSRIAAETILSEIRQLTAILSFENEPSLNAIKMREVPSDSMPKFLRAQKGGLYPPGSRGHWAEQAHAAFQVVNEHCVSPDWRPEQVSALDELGGNVRIALRRAIEMSSRQDSDSIPLIHQKSDHGRSARQCIAESYARLLEEWPIRLEGVSDAWEIMNLNKAISGIPRCLRQVPLNSVVIRGGRFIGDLALFAYLETWRPELLNAPPIPGESGHFSAPPIYRWLEDHMPCFYLRSTRTLFVSRVTIARLGVRIEPITQGIIRALVGGGETDTATLRNAQAQLQQLRGALPQSLVEEALDWARVAFRDEYVPWAAIAKLAESRAVWASMSLT